MNGTANQKAAGAGDNPAELLREVQSLRSQVGAAAPGYWLPLLVFGAVICGSLPFYRHLPTTRPAWVLRTRNFCRSDLPAPALTCRSPTCGCSACCPPWC